MYTCVRALLRLRGDNQRITEQQVGDNAVRQLAADYTLVQLVLTHPAIDHEVSLNLDSVSDLVYQLQDTVTVNQWLSALGSTALPTSDLVLKKTVGVAKYNEVANAGYTLELRHPTIGAGSELPDVEKTDVLVTKAGMDYKLLYDHCLFKANGLLHIADYSTAGLRIKDAGKSVQHSNRTDLGMISFSDVGKISTYPITDAMLFPSGTNSFRDGFIIGMPDVDLSTKIVMLSIGGFLHMPGYCSSVTGDHSILVEWWKIPFYHRYYNSNKLIDLSSFEATLVRNPDAGDALDLNQAMSDVSIKAYMQLPQTFVICLEADHFYYDRHAVEPTLLPGRYYTYSLPQYPLQLENGLLPEYMAIGEDGAYCLAMQDNLVNRYVHDTRPYGAEDNYVTGARWSSAPVEYGSAYLLEMGTEYLS